MPTQPPDLAPATGTAKKTSAATRLLQAAAFAAVLVPLGSVAVETASITCFAGSGCFGAVGSYAPGAENDNTWEFFAGTGYGSPLVYMLRIQAEGDVSDEFTLEVGDTLIDPGFFSGSGAFAGWDCVHVYSPYCVIFDVSPHPDGEAYFNPYYLVTITWWADPGDPLSNPLSASILRDGGWGFDSALEPLFYDREATPPSRCYYGAENEEGEIGPCLGDLGDDPAIGGRGNGFSDFTVGVQATPVPEPMSLVLVGSGLVGAFYRARRRKRQP